MAKKNLRSDDCDDEREWGESLRIALIII